LEFRALKFYQDNPEIMILYIQKKLGIKDAQLARRMYDDAGDKFSISTDGELGSLDGLFAVGCAVATALRCKRHHDAREPAYTQVQYRL